MSELSLFDKDPGFLTAPATPLERRFAKFHKDNPEVYRLIEQWATDCVRRGRRRIGIAEMVEELRYSPQLVTYGDHEFKMNNSYRAFYARLLIHRNPSLEGVIETRRQTQHRRAEK